MGHGPICAEILFSDGLFTLPVLGFGLEKPNGNTALSRSFHNAQSQIQIQILNANYRKGIGIRVCTRVRQCK